MSRELEILTHLAQIEGLIEAAASQYGRGRAEITLIAVTKNFPVSDIHILYEAGLRNFGENRDQEAAEKVSKLPSDIHWHFQGQVQSRKINSISRWAEFVHSLDSLDHARKFDEVSKSAVKGFFLQVNFQPERSDRGGVTPALVENFLQQLSDLAFSLPIGLMTVAPTDRPPEIYFQQLAAIQERLSFKFPTLQNLSMGMSGDFAAAIAAGSTHLRIGSSILGSRR